MGRERRKWQIWSHREGLCHQLKNLSQWTGGRSEGTAGVYSAFTVIQTLFLELLSELTHLNLIWCYNWRNRGTWWRSHHSLVSGRAGFWIQACWLLSQPGCLARFVIGLLCMRFFLWSLNYMKSTFILWMMFGSCLTLCNPMDCSPPGSFVHGILQARILGRVAISFSRGSSQPRNRTHVSSKSPALQANSLLWAIFWIEFSYFFATDF